MDAATQRQNQAAEPHASTWLSANAGSGKTRVLTDRVARLLLNTVDPQNILCLTYTKAAASEMQNRLFKRLGAWAMKSDADLKKELAGLGVDNVSDPVRLTGARRLFARAIETPGGLRIQTIHSFCASLLRRFPLEAGVTPNFVEMDDRTAALLRDEILEELADRDGPSPIDAIATHYSGDDLGKLTQDIVSARESLAVDVTRDDVLGWFDLPAGYSLQEALEEAFDGSERDLLDVVIPALLAGSSNDQKAAARLQGFDWSMPGAKALEELIGLMLFGPKTKLPLKAKIGSFPTKPTQTALGGHCDALNDLMLRVEAVRGRLFSLYAAEKSAVLYDFARAFLPAYEARKQRNGWLDFDDLIRKTRDLLSNEAVAAWVLFRLDGGLDHILVDEAQDTSPAQWQVIERLAQEFTSGLGARDDVLRTVFVVGDVKQSIYSFQGADPREFERMRLHFSSRLEAVNTELRDMELEFSFRSSDAILRFVDQLIAVDGMRHRAFQDDLPGRVDLWPPVPKTEPVEKRHWYDPIDTRTDDHQDVVLARRIAAEIARMIKTETIPAKEGTRRRIRPRDFLILVRRRTDLFEELIRACKALNLPVAGADRLKLGAELAVKDIGAVLAFLATPEDDLSLAAALRSPLLGWTEAQLYDLAAGRGETYLWPALRDQADAFAETLAMLHDLRNNADFLRPYDLIERILTRHDGRRRLLARLGPEAEDGIDALLTQALTYERMDVPSLTGFLTWMQTDEIEIKRQVDSAGDLIRVMTVHGAKGLESPIVILPDTAKRTPPIRGELVPLDTGQMVWRMPADQQPEAMVAALSRLKAEQEAENERLFYVATTRAETWLIIAAAGEVGDAGDSWHQTAQGALQDLGATALSTPVGEGLRLSHLDWTAGALNEEDTSPEPEVALPDWAEARIEPAGRPVGTLAPSGLGGAKAIWSDGDVDEETALRRGRMLHLLLEILPHVPSDRWGEHAEQVLTQSSDAGTADEAASVLQDARAVLESPEFAFLFDEDVMSEVEISANLPDLGGARVAGAIDKLVVSDTHVLAVDFKTNAVVPTAPGDVPEGILRQMGAYQGALQAVYPDKRVDTAILWTRGPILMRLPHDIVRQALCRYATS
ncbi:MAG: double-strand break repair helicase AddA [Rhodobacter sp.]|nr:double-strand break repair helicase AddA [Rhodobacter sp.]